MASREKITSAFAPDLDEVRMWLQRMIAALRFVELVTAVLALVGRMRDINTELTRQLSQLGRGRPRSETLERLESQLVLPHALFAIGQRPTRTSKASESNAKTKRSRRGRHPGRAPFPAHLERVEVQNKVPAADRTCPLCGREMKTVGHSKCEILDVVPARVVVTVRLDERVACAHDDAITSAPTPPAIVERGKLGDSFIVEALADKFLEHLPVERQCTRWARNGVDIAPQTLGRSINAAIDLLAPVARCIREQTRAPGLLATDASSIPVLDPEAPHGIRYGTMWCWTNAAWVTFFYSPAGDSQSVRRFLGDDLARTVQCDGTSVTSFLERCGGRRPGCWSHGRRRLVDAARLGDAIALDGLHLIAPLFAIERAATCDGDTAPMRLARRLAHSRPVLDKLRAWVEDKRAIAPPKTPLGRALGYLHRQWHRLVLFLEDGNIELTNNRRERELRRLVLGRRNWLFTWRDTGGERIAQILTIIGSCIAHDVNPRAYLHRVTKLLVGRWPRAQLRELLPDRMLVAHPELQGPRPALELLPG